MWEKLIDSVLGWCTTFLALLLSVVWLARSPDWEPAIAVVTTLSAFIALEVHGRKRLQELHDELAQLKLAPTPQASEPPLAEASGELRFRFGMASPYFATDPDQQVCALDVVRVVIHAGAIKGMMELLPLLEKAARAHCCLLVVAREFCADTLPTLVTNKNRGTLRVCAIQMSDDALGFRASSRLARFSGAKVFGDEAGLDLASADLEDLGLVDSIAVSSDWAVVRKVPPVGAVQAPSA